MVVGLLGACAEPEPDKEPRRARASQSSEEPRDPDAPKSDASSDEPDASSDEPGASSDEPGADPTPDEPRSDAEPSGEAPREEPAAHDPVDTREPPPKETMPRCTGSGVVTSQAYLDAFFKGCKAIGDSVYIDASAVDNLDALSEVESIAGDLVIAPGVTYPFNDNRAWFASDRLKSLAGLSKLRQVRTLILRALPFTDLSGLERLRWGSVSLARMESLQSLTGLGESLDGAAIELKGVPALRDLTGLRGGVVSVVIEEAAAFRDLSGASVARINHLTIKDAPSLRTLEGGSVVEGLSLTNAPLLRDLAAVRGRARLNGLTLKGLPSLRSLTDLTGVDWLGMLRIEDCDGLEDLTGLELVSYYEVFNIHDCANLRSLTGLEGLSRLDYGLELRHLPRLESLHGLGKLTRAGALILRDLPSLIDFSGLDSLISLGGFYLEGRGPKSLQGLGPLRFVGSLTADRTSLESLDGLALEQLHSLNLIDNPKLARIDALRSLSVGSSITLSGNPAIVDLAGLDGIAGIPHLTLRNNIALRDLRALSKVQSVSEAQILGNVQLPQCEIEWLAQRAGFETQDLDTNGPIGVCEP